MSDKKNLVGKSLVGNGLLGYYQWSRLVRIGNGFVGSGNDIVVNWR
jgi:hypothetical protein